jgi:hypothetical protein
MRMGAVFDFDEGAVYGTIPLLAVLYDQAGVCGSLLRGESLWRIIVGVAGVNRQARGE